MHLARRSPVEGGESDIGVRWWLRRHCLEKSSQPLLSGEGYRSLKHGQETSSTVAEHHHLHPLPTVHGKSQPDHPLGLISPHTPQNPFWIRLNTYPGDSALGETTGGNKCAVRTRLNAHPRLRYQSVTPPNLGSSGMFNIRGRYFIDQ
ncbi:hypothetical protein Tco_1215129 [Tanacetum coccineum]